MVEAGPHDWLRMRKGFVPTKIAQIEVLKSAGFRRIDARRIRMDIITGIDLEKLKTASGFAKAVEYMPIKYQ